MKPMGFAPLASACCRPLILFLAMGLLLTASAAAAAQPMTTDASQLVPTLVRHQGLHRVVRLYRPERLADRPALVIALHGSGGDGARLRQLTAGAFDQLAENHGWLVAYPDGLGRQWRDCRGRTPFSAALSGVDDVDFLRAVITHASRAVDRPLAGVFVLGYSNGGQMVFRLAMEAPGEFNALAAIGASLPAPDELSCEAKGSAPPIMLVGGTEDPISPWSGGSVRAPDGAELGAVRSFEATVEHFRALAPAAGLQRIVRHRNLVADGTHVESRYFATDGRPKVVMMIVHGGGHALPHPTAPFPESLVGRVSRDVDGALAIWRFFARRLRPWADQPQPPPATESTVYPIPRKST